MEIFFGGSGYDIFGSPGLLPTTYKVFLGISKSENTDVCPSTGSLCRGTVEDLLFIGTYGDFEFSDIFLEFFTFFCTGDSSSDRLSSDVEGKTSLRLRTSRLHSSMLAVLSGFTWQSWSVEWMLMNDFWPAHRFSSPDPDGFFETVTENSR